MDRLTPWQRSRLMARIRGDDLGPETRLADALTRAGVDFERNVRDLPGRPDFEIECGDSALAVFVHGCFWHRCPRHWRQPRANAQWWADKIAGNVRRDARVRRQLLRMHHRTMVVWEHDLRDAAAADRAAARVARRAEAAHR